MTKQKMIRLIKDCREELRKYEQDSGRRPTREAHGREEAYRHAGELVEGVLDCMRWV